MDFAEVSSMGSAELTVAPRNQSFKKKRLKNSYAELPPRNRSVKTHTHTEEQFYGAPSNKLFFIFFCHIDSSELQLISRSHQSPPPRNPCLYLEI